MNFSEFCKHFYTGRKTTSGLKGAVGQRAIVDFFLRSALGTAADQVLILSDSTFTKWFTGERDVPHDIWERAELEFDEEFFSRSVTQKLNDSVITVLLDGFGIRLSNGETADKLALSGAITRQFKAIIEGHGEAEDIVAAAYYEQQDVEEFPTYIQNSYDKYSKLKTLLYSSEERPFDEFFVCNDVCIRRVPHRRRVPDQLLIQNVTLEKLKEKSSFVLLVGMGGIGKSMMMRHLFLVSNRSYHESGMLPILVTLREFGGENKSLFDIVVDSVHRYDVTFSALNAKQLLSSGKCQLLLDGLDEIKTDDIEDFQHQLEIFVDMYPHNQYVMSTRKFSNFVGLSRFKIFFMMPFKNEQALELIDKLEFCPEEPKLKQQFRERLEKELFKTHWEFVTNPLLLTLMLMNYHRFAEIPEKKYLFYEQAYQTLLQRHDADKLAYKRVFRSVKDTSDFTQVFREFCAKSYRKGDYEFDESKFKYYFERLQSKKRLNLSEMTVENFLFDACHSACLMYEEGQSYHFLHRSFQEYFFADYYSKQDDDIIRKLGRSLESPRKFEFDDSDALDMLYDLAPDRVEKFIFIPFLSDIFDAENGVNSYWRFLSTGYNRWRYVIFNSALADKYKVASIRPRPYDEFPEEPLSNILSLIMRKSKINGAFRAKFDTADFTYEELTRYILLGEQLDTDEDGTAIISVVNCPADVFEEGEELKKDRFYKSLLRDEQDSLVVFGRVYVFAFNLAMKNPERYAGIMNSWDNPNFEAHKIYEKVKDYYCGLKQKIEVQASLDDDDF